MLRMKGIIPRARSTVRDFVRTRLPSLNRRIGTFHLSEDRQLLETSILTYLRDDPAINRILFVGCEWYTKHYEKFFKAKEYWTLEIDPAKRRYGGRRHIVDSLKNLGLHAPRDYFDAIVCNGVFMKTAIETREEAEPSFEACIDCLRTGGWYILGWNDTDELRPYPPCESPALAALIPTAFPSLGASEHRTNTSYRHTYTFYTKPKPLPGDVTAAPTVLVRK
jgi:hypothetical protein